MRGGGVGWIYNTSVNNVLVINTSTSVYLIIGATLIGKFFDDPFLNWKWSFCQMSYI